MSTRTITVEVVVQTHGHDGKWSIPSLHMHAADVEGAPFDEITVSLSNPFVSYLHSEGSDQNHGFLATVNTSGIFSQIADQWEEINAPDPGEGEGVSDVDEQAVTESVPAN